MTISMDKKYTSNGKPVRILCTDGGGTQPVVTIIDTAIETFTSSGQFCNNGVHIYDLVEVWEPKKGEYCLFFDNGGTIAALAKFTCYLGNKYTTHNGCAYNKCVEFTGELPKEFV